MLKSAKILHDRLIDDFLINTNMYSTTVSDQAGRVLVPIVHIPFIFCHLVLMCAE